MAQEIHRTGSELTVGQSSLELVMGENGFTRSNNEWLFDARRLQIIGQDLNALKISYFGPSKADNRAFFSNTALAPNMMKYSLGQESVINTIEKYRRVDISVARRLSFMLGGVVREMHARGFDGQEIADGIDYVAGLTVLGEKRSGEAIAASMALYTFSGETRDDDKDFEGLTYKMGEAIKEDPVVPENTLDLGLSQVARIRHFADRRDADMARYFPNIKDELAVLQDLPTVGAEFHFELNDPGLGEKFWKRVALLNMSQYQQGSSIQMSRNDRDIVEIRMNPSVYAVTVANWMHLKRVLPELENAYFTITLNRPESKSIFKNTEPADLRLRDRLKQLGLLSYAAVYNNAYRQKSRAEVDFGTAYFGQTVRLSEEAFEYTGLWNKDGGVSGQLGIYAGFGNNFPYLAYYPSMALANPHVLDRVTAPLTKANTLQGALSFSPIELKGIFASIHREMSRDPRLSRASRAGDKIVTALTI